MGTLKKRFTGLGRPSVNGYVPYMKVVYKSERLSLDVERIYVFRNK